MNAQISPLILTPPVLLNLVVRAVPLSDSRRSSLSLRLVPETHTGGSAAQDRQKKTNIQKGLGDGRQGLHTKAPICLTFNPRL